MGYAAINLGTMNRAAAIIALASALCGAESIKLADGTVVQGEIVQRNDSIVTLRSPSLGTLTLPARELASRDAQASEPRASDERAAAGPGSARKESASIAGREPSDQALFFMPTAFTPPSGSFTFRDFELLYLTLGYAPTDATSLTGGFLFPLSPEFQVLTVGAKQRLWQSPDGLAAAALTANFTKPLGVLGNDLSYLLNSNLVAGKRTGDGYGVHAAIGYLGAGNQESGWDGSFTYAVGVESRLTPHVKFLAEYLSAVPVGTGDDIDGGLLSLGIRLHGDRLSADIAGIRPITLGDLDGFLFAPLLVVSYRY